MRAVSTTNRQISVKDWFVRASNNLLKKKKKGLLLVNSK